MKLYSFLGRLYFLIFIYISSTTWALPYEKRSSHVDLHYSRKKHTNGKWNNIQLNNHLKVLFNKKDIKLHLGNDHETSPSVQLQEITTYKYSGNVLEYKNSQDDVSLAEALTEEADEKSSINMVLPIAGTLAVLFSMSILVALFQCCCRKRQTSDSEEIKDNDKLVESEKSGKEVQKDEQKPTEQSQGSENGEKEVTSIKSKIKAFEGKIPTQPSPGLVRPTKKRPESEAFKALENQGIIFGMGKSPSRLTKTPEEENPPSKLPKTPEDENQNATPTEEVSKPDKKEEKEIHDDDLGDYKERENPDVVIADMDEDDEFAVIKRDTSVLRSHKRAPPPKNRNRSSAAVRRKRARETTTDLLFNDSSDNPFLNVPDDLEVVYTDKSSVKSDNMEDSKEIKTTKTDSMETNKNEKNVNSSDRNKYKKNKNKKVTDPLKNKKEEPPTIVTSDHSDDNIIDLSKQEVDPNVFSGGNIFMHIDPTVKKNVNQTEKKPATPPATRIRNSQLSVEERKEKAKSTPLFSSHDDLASALGKLRSPSKENTSEKSAGMNRSSSDLTSNTKM